MFLHRPAKYFVRRFGDGKSICSWQSQSCCSQAAISRLRRQPFIAAACLPATHAPGSNQFHRHTELLIRARAPTLTWSVSGATSVRIDPNVGPVPAYGSQVVSSGNTTTYILTANNPSGVITNTTIVSVSSYPSYSTGSPSYPPYPIYPYNPNYGSMPVIVTFSIRPAHYRAGRNDADDVGCSRADTVNISPSPGWCQHGSHCDESRSIDLL